MSLPTKSISSYHHSKLCGEFPHCCLVAHCSVLGIIISDCQSFCHAGFHSTDFCSVHNGNAKFHWAECKFVVHAVCQEQEVLFFRFCFAVLPHKFVLWTGQGVMEDAAKLWFPIFSPFIAHHSAPAHRNRFDFLPTAIRPNMLDEEKSSQQEK